jgi:hypothetical protein
MATKCESLSVWPTADSASPTRESASARSPRFTASSARYRSAHKYASYYRIGES